MPDPTTPAPAHYEISEEDSSVYYLDHGELIQVPLSAEGHITDWEGGAVDWVGGIEDDATHDRLREIQERLIRAEMLRLKV